MDDWIKAALASTGVSSLLLIALGWLVRTWLSERLTASIQHEFDEKLEVLRAQHDGDLERLRHELSSQQAIPAAATAAMLSARAAAHDRTLDAVQDLWQRVLRIRDLVAERLPPLAFMTREDILKLPIPLLSREEIRQALAEWCSSEIASPAIESSRPLVGDVLWSYFFAYRAFTGRTCMLYAGCAPGGFRAGHTFFLDDDHCRRILESVLSPAEMSEIEQSAVGAFAKASGLLEQRISLEARKVITGGSSAEGALEQARDIMEASASAMGGCTRDTAPDCITGH